MKDYAINNVSDPPSGVVTEGKEPAGSRPTMAMDRTVPDAEGPVSSPWPGHDYQDANYPKHKLGEMQRAALGAREK